MFRTLLSFSFLIFWLAAHAVDFNNYIPIRSEGRIPESFLSNYDDELAKKLEEINHNDSRFDQKNQKDFYQKSTFSMKNMLFSGKILFNDPISRFVEKVGKEVLRYDQALLNQIQFFTIKSPSVNAFATDQGYIFVTVGLLAQLETEAQLAMVLAHEATHIQKKHSVNKYVESKKIEKGKGNYTSVAWGEKEFAAQKFSKELEEEADKVGFDQYYKTSNYSYAKLLGLFDVLEYSFLPYDELALDKSFFENKHIKFPKEYFLEAVADITPPEDEENSSHPNINKRRQYMSEKLSSLDNQGREEYVIGQSQFEWARKIARYELSTLYITNHQYGEALYNSYLNIKKYGSDIYNRRILAQSMYVLAKYSNDYSDIPDEILTDYNEVQGESQQVFHFFEKIEAKELSVFASAFLWSLHFVSPEDKSLSNMATDMLNETISIHQLKETDFSRVPWKELLLQESSTVTEDYESLSKYDKIKLKNNEPEQDLSQSKSFVPFAFVELFKQSEFEEAFNLAVEKSTHGNNSYSRNRRLTSREKRKGLRLGVDKVVFVDPNYIKLKKSGEMNVEYSESEEANTNLNDILVESSRKCEMKIDILDDHYFRQGDLRQYNDYCFLSHYIEFIHFHEDRSINLVGLYTNEIDLLVETYNTKFFAWTGYVSVKEQANWFNLLYALYPLATPFVIAYFLKSHYSTMHYYLLLDIETGKFLWKNAQVYKTSDSQSMVKATTHDVLYQTARKEK